MNTQTVDRVALLDVKRQTATLRPEIDAAIARVLDHSQFILGPEVTEFEAQIAEYCGARFAVGCASGSDAIMLPLLALGIRPGDRVVTTPFTFFASGGYVVRAGATPLFVDIDPVTFNMDPQALQQLLESLSPSDLSSVRAILPIHLFGLCADMPAINSIAGRFGIPVIEDAAQAIGAEIDGRRAGALAHAGSLSFFPSKNLGAMGDGGLVITNDPDFNEKLRLLRVHGSGTTYYHRSVGVNSRLDTLQAAILLVKLRHLEQWTEGRRANAALYARILKGQLPEFVSLPSAPPNCRHIYNQFTIRVRNVGALNRDIVRARLTEANVGTSIYYPLPLHLQECFAYLGYRTGDFPNSELASAEVLSLPIESGLSEAEIAFVAERLENACRTL